MTGFARSLRPGRGRELGWEVKTVNAKGLDLRLRLPPGFDGLEAQARARVAATGHAGHRPGRRCRFSVPEPEQRLRIDRDKLAALVEAVSGDRSAVRTWLRRRSTDCWRSPASSKSTERDGQAGDGSRSAPRSAGLDEALDALGPCARARARRWAASSRPGSRRSPPRRRRRGGAGPHAAGDPRQDRARGSRSSPTPCRPSTDAAASGSRCCMAAKADVREELDRLTIHRAAAAALLG